MPWWRFVRPTTAAPDKSTTSATCPNGFDILIVSPNEAAALTPVIDEVYKAGIPVVIFDRNINSRSYTARIGADDEGTGRARPATPCTCSGVRPAPSRYPD